MKLLILLGIEGVLIPAAREAGPGPAPESALSDTRAALVARLGALGRIAWVSTWPAEQTHRLEKRLQLPAAPFRVPLLSGILDATDAATPKLRPVSRWLARMEVQGEADWDAVVWIDDMFGADAGEWAHRYGRPVLLEKPTPAQGLTEVHVVAVEVFVAGIAGD